MGNQRQDSGNPNFFKKKIRTRERQFQKAGGKIIVRDVKEKLRELGKIFYFVRKKINSAALIFHRDPIQYGRMWSNFLSQEAQQATEEK